MDDKYKKREIEEKEKNKNKDKDIYILGIETSCKKWKRTSFKCYKFTN